MSGTTISSNIINKKKSLAAQIWKKRGLFLLFIPGFLMILLFHYGPMYGIVLAFKEYNIGKGISGSPWVGLQHFQTFFSSHSMMNILKNTIVISVLKLIFGFPAPIILAITLNEIKNGFFKRTIQTITYLPHFLSWVIVSSIVIGLLSPNTGVINHLLKLIGLKPIYFMVNEKWFRPVLIMSAIWKEVGWGAVIYLAAICGIDTQLYEAATIDGASKLQRIVHITVPSLAPVFTILLLLSVGKIMNAGFDQVFNMYNPMVYSVADIIDTYVYRVGLVNFKYSFNTAVGLFKSVAGIILMLITNAVIRSFGQDDLGLWVRRSN